MNEDEFYIIVFPVLDSYASKLLMRFNRLMRNEGFKKIHRGVYYRKVFRLTYDALYFNYFKKEILKTLSKNSYVKIIEVSLKDFENIEIIKSEVKS